MADRPPRDHRRMLEQTYGLDPAPPDAARPKRVEPRRYQPLAQAATAPQPMPARTDHPRLRLVGTDAEPRQPEPAQAHVQPIESATDPRWVLAVRTSEQLQGSILTPESRHRLMRVGKLLGLNPFDCSLVIAIVQDQARRGRPADLCAAAARAQLQMVPVRHAPAGSFAASLRRINVWQLAGILTAAIAVELLVLKMIFG